MKNIIAILKLSRPLYRTMLIISILIITGTLLSLVAPLLSKTIVDEVTIQITGGHGDLNRLIQFIFLAFIASIGSISVQSVSERLGDYFAGRLRKFLTVTFYDKAFTLPQSYYDSELSGKIVNQLVRGIQTIQNFLNAATNFILPTFLQSFLIVIILLRYDIFIAGFIACLFPVYILLSHRSTVRWGKEEGIKNQIEDIIRGRITEVIGNMSLVKSFSRQWDEYGFVDGKLTESNIIYARQSNVFHVYDFMRNFTLQVILFAVNVFVFWKAFHGTITLGETVLILQLVNQARLPLFAMSFILTQLQLAEAGSKEYLEILNLKSAEGFRRSQNLAKSWKDPTIKFENVDFSYIASHQVLKTLSLSFDQNQTIALVGPSGAGKSTIVNLILKFYEPTSGRISVNGQDYREIDHDTVRANIALVFQDNELFSTSIRENVTYGFRKASENQIKSALIMANAWDFVQKLPKKLDTGIGERGLRLSGGQKQRIQIARAILKNAPVLILDEATSSLDARSENEVHTAMQELIKNRLVIVIAHRFSTIQNADKIIVIEDGKLIDQGSPVFLAKKPGLYSDLLRYQIEGNRKLLERYELY